MMVFISQPMAGKTQQEIIKTRERAIRTLRESGYEINCLRCGYCGKTAFTKRGAVEKWNNDKERAK